MRLSQSVAQQRNRWQLNELEKEAQVLVRTAVTVTEREAAKNTLAKIHHFIEIQRRFEQVAATPGPVSQSLATTQAPTASRRSSPVGVAPELGLPAANRINAPAVYPSSPPAADRVAQPTRRRKFDAEGILKPVVSRRPDAPRYALVDDGGRVLSFVTPTPDVDVEPFLGKHVGIAGRREYLPGFRRSHFTAGRISTLDSGRLVR